jgi:DUF1365 family protein
MDLMRVSTKTEFSDVDRKKKWLKWKEKGNGKNESRDKYLIIAKERKDVERITWRKEFDFYLSDYFTLPKRYLRKETITGELCGKQRLLLFFSD